MNKPFLVFLFFLIGAVGHAQVDGEATFNGAPVSGARIVIKKGDNLLAYKFTSAQGKFAFDVAGDSLTIESSYLGFEKQTLFILKTPATGLRLEFERQIEVLEEIQIRNRLPARQKRDTVVYDLEAFKDGSERVIEDLLKKLPGVSVLENGKITFKGQEIKALMLDGDDLFSSRYTIGSKNLDVDLVESVEAIENFNQNKVLHQIARTKDVAINLKLKKGRSDFDMNSTLYTDFYSKYHASATALLLSSKTKGFSTLSINNIGISEAFGFDGDVSDSRLRHKTPQLISQGAFPDLAQTRSLLNNTVSATNSVLFNLSEKLSSTLAADIYKDKLWQEYRANDHYIFDDQDFAVSNSERLVKRPFYFALSNRLSFYNGTDFQIDGAVWFDSRESDFASEVTNNGIPLATAAGSGQTSFSAKADATKKLSLDSALKFSAYFKRFESRENLFLSSQVIIDSTTTANNQMVGLEGSFFLSHLEYYKSWEKYKLKISNFTGFANEDFNSALREGQNSIGSFENDFTFRTLLNELTAELTAKYKRLSLAIRPSFSYSRASAATAEATTGELLINAGVKYFVRKKHSVNFEVHQFLEAPLLQNIFKNPVLTSYRTVLLNEGELGTIKNTSASLAYEITDFYNTFFFKTGVSYTVKNRGYYSDAVITPSLFYNRQVLLDFGNERFALETSVHKLIPFIKTNMKFNTSVSRTSFYNFVGQSDVRSVRSHAIAADLLLIASLTSRLTFQNKIYVTSNIFKAEGQSNQLTQLRNELKLTYKLSETLNIQSNLTTFQPEAKAHQRYHFLNSEIAYRFKKYDWDLYLTGQNLFNHKSYRTVGVSDYAVSSFSYRLQERNVLFGIRLKLF